MNVAIHSLCCEILYKKDVAGKVLELRPFESDNSSPLENCQFCMFFQETLL